MAVLAALLTISHVLCAGQQTLSVHIAGMLHLPARFAHPQVFAQYALAMCPPPDKETRGSVLQVLTECATRADDMACARERRPPTATDVLYMLLAYGRAIDAAPYGPHIVSYYAETLVARCGAQVLSSHASADRGFVPADMIVRWAETDAIESLCIAMNSDPGNEDARFRVWPVGVTPGMLYGAQIQTDDDPHSTHPPEGLFEMRSVASLLRNVSPGDEETSEHTSNLRRSSPLEHWMTPGPTLAALVSANKMGALAYLASAGVPLGPDTLSVAPFRPEHVSTVARTLASFAPIDELLITLCLPWLSNAQQSAYAAEVSGLNVANKEVLAEAHGKRGEAIEALNDALRSAQCTVPSRYVNTRSVVRALAAGYDGLCDGVVQRHGAPTAELEERLNGVVGLMADAAYDGPRSTINVSSVSAAISEDAPRTALALVRIIGGDTLDAYTEAASRAAAMSAWRVFQAVVFEGPGAHSAAVPMMSHACTPAACLRDAWSVLTLAMGHACSRVNCPTAVDLGRLAARRFFANSSAEDITRTDDWLGTPAMVKATRQWQMLARVSKAMPPAGLAALRRLDVLVGDIVYDIAITAMSENIVRTVAGYDVEEWMDHIVARAEGLLVGRSVGADAVVPGLRELASSMRAMVPAVEYSLVSAAASGRPRVLRRLAASYMAAGEKAEMLRALFEANRTTEPKYVEQALRALARAGVHLAALCGPMLEDTPPDPPTENKGEAPPRDASSVDRPPGPAPLVLGLAIALAIILAIVVLSVIAAAIVTFLRMRRGAE